MLATIANVISLRIINYISRGLSDIDGREAEIVILLDRVPGQLANLVDASRFALYCTPVINLFEKHTERVSLTPGDTECHVVPARLTLLDYEAYSVQIVYGQAGLESEELTFRPLYQTLNNDEGNYGRYFSTRRERPRIPRAATGHVRRMSARRYSCRW